MDAQEHNSCLLNMPKLVFENILSNIHNPSNVARTCKYLYEIVCVMEKRRLVMHVSCVGATSRLNIDDDAVFASIMNSHRIIKEIALRLDGKAPSCELKERQFERLTAIMKRFGASITSLNLNRFELPIYYILGFIQQAPKLESISLAWGKGTGSINQYITQSLQLSSLKVLEIDYFVGLSDIVNLIPAGSLNSVRYTDQSTESTEVLTTILTKQHNIKSLTVDVHSNSDLTAICVDHLQLETLKFRSYILDTDSKFLEILNCQTNLKELRFMCFNKLSGSAFQWICNNLKKLEVFEVQRVDLSLEANGFEMLGELKQLRHFRTPDASYFFVNGFQSSQFKSDSIKKFEFGVFPIFSGGELLNKMVNSMAHNLRNLTHITMKFENFSALCFVLGHCTKIIHLSSYICDPNPDQLAQQHFPSIQHLALCHYDNSHGTSDETMSQSMTSIVRAMPNLKNVSLVTRIGIKFDVNTMKVFIEESKNLEHLYVDRFVLHRELSADDVVGTIRRLTDGLKGYRIHCRPSTLPEDSHWHKIKEILSNEFYVLDNYRNLNPKDFSLYKGGEKKYLTDY